MLDQNLDGYANDYYEFEAHLIIEETIEDLIKYTADQGLWQWGDGRGGWFLQVIEATATRLGLEISTLPCPRPNPRRMTHSVRTSIMERDGFRCQHCGTQNNLTIDHIYPIVLGGSNEPDNLQVLCQSCNSRKGAKVADPA